MIQVHLDYIEAGANIIITASYQVPKYSFTLPFLCFRDIYDHTDIQI